MNDDVRIDTVTNANVDELRFFCMKSKPKSEGFLRKRRWLEDRFAEGMQIKILYEGQRSVGFIEYIPAEFAWRVVRAPDYLAIHCVWVVGSGKGKGYGSHLLGECLAEATQQGKAGVVMVTSQGNWLAGKKLLLQNGFEEVDQAPPSFSLMCKRFGSQSLPSFPGDWHERMKCYGPGLTLLTSDQCPYLDRAEQIVEQAAIKRGISFNIVRLTSAREIQENAACAYGLYALVYNGQLVTYHYETLDDLNLKIETLSRLV